MHPPDIINEKNVVASYCIELLCDQIDTNGINVDIRNEN